MDEELRAELLRRMKRDQAARLARDCDWETVAAVDAENLPWLKGVITERGWPGASLAGTSGAEAAWLLAQHADADPVFQRHCLGLLTAAVEAGEAKRRNLAYLTDRVLLAEGQPQVYGTQMTRSGEAWVPQNLGDPDGVDARRAAAGLEPLAEYVRQFDDHPVASPSRLKCPQCGAWAPFTTPEDDETVAVTCPECGLAMTIRIPRLLPWSAALVRDREFDGG
jgi:predicted RNA-binding Zn-ribbon protein involved in translation (DUF1610 family)